MKDNKKVQDDNGGTPVQIVFGVDTMGDALKKAGPNPMVHKFGKGPEGTKCSGCTQIVRQNYGPYNWFKCRLRGISRGNGTDHRLKWDACARYEARKPSEDMDVIFVAK